MGRTRKELGFLYARIGAYQAAINELNQALNAPDLDPNQKSQIEAQLPDLQKQLEPSRFSCRLQMGLRSQSNANYFPAGGLFDVGGVQIGTFGAKQPDVAFQLGMLTHDYDLQNQRGDIIETRAGIYTTQ